MSSDRRGLVTNQVAQALRGGNVCAELRALCKTYDEEDLHIALDFISPVNTAYHDVINGAIATLRHRQIEKRLKSLEKPHWTLVPTFWIVLAGTAIGFIGVAIALFAWREPVEPQATPLINR